jgi:membrane-bound ClpP family serine protease
VTDLRRGDGTIHGRAFTDGSWWSVRSETPLRDGDPAEVVRLDGLTLVVRPARAPEPLDEVRADHPQPTDPFPDQPSQEDT